MVLLRSRFPIFSVDIMDIHGRVRTLWTGCLKTYCNVEKICVSFFSRTNVPIPLRKENKKMSAVDKLISYIMTLTPEQVDKVVNQLPRLSALLGESDQPCHQEQFSQKQ